MDNQNLPTLSAIATISTPFSEKFTIPRQSQIIHQAQGIIQFMPDYCHPEAFNGLDAFSHYWLIWGFHLNQNKAKTLSVRPPRLGGNKKTSVFATRSPFRPNNLGLSLVKIDNIDTKKHQLKVSGVDILSGSSIYDIKPYIPYADCQIDARADWASSAPVPQFTVKFSDESLLAIKNYEKHHQLALLPLIKSLLSYDPRPAYKSTKNNTAADCKTYATTLHTLDIVWKINGQEVFVISARKVKT